MSTGAIIGWYAIITTAPNSLMPRANAGVLLDLQAVPRAIPPSQFRKSASSALLLDRRAPGPTDVLIEIAYCGVCHSDIHMVDNGWGQSVYPIVPGHEIAGVVTAVGAITPEELAPLRKWYVLGKAAIVRPGNALTILAYGTMVHVAKATVEDMGIDAEIIDLRTLVPLDIEAIEASVEKTGRCLVVHEATRTSGFGAELSALVQERCFYHLEAPVERVTGFDTPYPHSLEWAYFPGPVRIGEAIDKILEA